MVTRKKKTYGIIFIIVALLAGIIGYRIYANLEANKERAGRVSQGRAVAVEIGTVAKQDITPVLSFSANLEPVWSADISPKVDGRIDQLYVDEGDFVTAGMVIAVLDTNELQAQVVQAQGNLFSSKASLEQAELDLNRTAALAEQGAVSVQALDTARIKRDLALGQVQSAEGNLSLLQARLENANVVAPRTGIVVKRQLQAGFYAKAGSPIVTIADITSLLAKATVSEGQISELSVGSAVKIKVNALSGKEFTGNITRISPAAALPARTFTAEITIPNDDNILKSGMFAKVEIPGAVHTGAAVVPESALVMREDQKTIYIVTADNKAQQKLLKLGYVGNGIAEVLDGVKIGDKIVIAGQNKIKDGASLAGAGAQEGGK